MYPSPARRLRLALAAAALLAAFAPWPGSGVNPGPAHAGINDNFSLSKTDDVEGEALIGEHVTYTLTATGTQASAAYLYNLSFRDVLPAGVEFVSASPAPTAVLSDTPISEQTTVIWENVSDLPAAAQSSVTVTVDTNPDFAGGTSGSTTVPVGATITNTSQAVASLDAFAVPDWDDATGQFTGDFDGTASASDTVEIIPFRVTRTAPGELLRGVHTNGFDGASGTVGAPFTIVVENNPDYAVTGVALVDTIDPALEFLGCDTYYPADNTTVGEEWTGSGPLATGTGCAPTPTTVGTGPGGETVVTWALGDLNPGDAATVTYQAGIPLLANAPFTGTPPSEAGLGQGRNLDNNTGPSTGEPDRSPATDPELLTAPEPQLDNAATATGLYFPTGAIVNDSGTVVVESEDLVIGKTMAGTLVAGSTVVTTLTVSTSEYRDFTNLVVRDLLPSGLCFLGTYNVDNTAGGSDWSTVDCPGAGTVQSTIDGIPVDVAEVRELPDGGPYGTGRFELVWDFADPDNSALADLDADGTLTITYQAVVREFYRGGLAQLAGEPVLAGDRVTNEAEISGPDTIADLTLPADGADPDGGLDGDTASASIANGFPTINKRLAVKTGPVADGANVTAATCGASHGPITWVEADPTPELGYGPGDIICVELGASFPSDVTYEGVIIEDLVPPGFAYVNGSATRIASIDTVAGTTVTESAAVVRFSLDGSGVVDPAGNEFRWVIAMQATGPSGAAANDIAANLEKLIHNNNGGRVYQHRDQAEAEWTEPEVRLAKGVDSVNGGSSNGPDFDGSLAGGSTAVIAAGSDVVTYRIDVWNIGNKAALSTEIQDVLPTGLACTDVAAISDGGSCSAGRITWTGLTVPASTGGGDLTPDDHSTAPITLTYDLTVPGDVDPGGTWTNTAGVASYEADTNTASVQAYYPADNIDAANAALENTDAADDESYLTTPAPGLTTLVRSAIGEAGNAANPALAGSADEATIGEIVQYEVTLTIPEGTTAYDGVVTDTIPTGLTYFTGNGLFAGTVSNLQPTVTSPTGDTSLTLGTLSHNAGVVTYTLPTPYANAGGSGDDQVAITFYALVDDVAGNIADPTATRFGNSAVFDYDDSLGAARPTVTSPTVDVDVVEPNPAIVKDHTAPAGTEAAPGDAITYRITIDNPVSANNVSTAHDVTVVDTVPAGLTPLGPGAVPVSSDGDTVPSSGVTPTGSFTGTWSETNHTVTWTPTDHTALDTVDPGTMVQFTYDVEVDDPSVAAGALTNSAALTAFSLDQDLAPTADPNEAEARSYSSNEDDTIDLPAASIGKDIEPFNGADPGDDRSGATIGEPVDYELSVTVPSGVVAYDATIFDDLPTSLDFDSFGPVTIGTECEVFDAGTGTTTGTSLTAGAVETFSPVGGDLQLAAWFLGDIYADGACTIDVQYTAHVNTSVVAGDAIANDGRLAWNGSDAVASQTPAALPDNYDDPNSASWTATSDPAVETVGVVEPALEIDEDVATTTGAALTDPTCDISPGNHNGTSDDADGSAPDGCDTGAGSQLRYTVTASNAGSSSAHDATVVAAVPAGLTPLASPGGSPVTTDGQTVTGNSGSVGIWSETNHAITWTLAGPIPPAGSQTVDYDVQVDASDGLTRGQDLTGTADVATYHGLSSADRVQVLLDNPANDDLVLYGNDPSATRGSLTPDQVTVEVHFPTLTVGKAAGSGQDTTDARLDASFPWTITVTNTDAVAPAFGVDLVDVLPEGWTYDAGSAQVTTPHSGGPVQVEPTCSASPSGSCATAADLNTETLTWTGLVAGSGEPLGPGETITIELTATPRSAALASSQAIGESFTGYSGGTGFAHSNGVTVTGEDGAGATTCCDPDGPGGADPETYTATDDDEVFIARADIEVAKTISPLDDDIDPDNGPYWFGSYVDYTVTVENKGPDQATGVTIADVLDPTELAFDSVVSAGQGSFDDTTDVWTVGTLANGTSAALVLRARLVGLGSVINIAQNQTTDQYDADSSPGNSVATEDDQGSVEIEVVPSSLGDEVWLDRNGDGSRDAGEPGIPGVQLDLSWNDPGTGSPMSYTVVTGSDGSYGVPPSVGLPVDTDITVTVNTAASPNLAGLSPSWDRDLTADGTTTEQVTSGDTTLPGGGLADLEFDFGYVTSTAQTLGSKLWWDVDGSGDASGGTGEPGIGGVTITATWAGWDDIAGTADDVAFTESTAATGDYLFTGLPPGEYVVSVTTTELPNGLDTATYDLDGLGGSSTDNAEITLAVSENQLDVDFSYRGTGMIGDTVWFDHDGDGAVDAGEPGLGGATVTATWDGPDGIAGNADDIVLATTTAVDGTYSFDNLPTGEFVVTVDDGTLPGNLEPTFDADGVATAHTTTIDLTTVAPDATDQDFGYRGLGSIGDTLFYDVDGSESDGTLDAGDSAIPGVDVTVLWAGADAAFGTADDFSATDTTDGSGRYLVTDLPHGQYRITVDAGDLPGGLDAATYDGDGTGTPGRSDTTLSAASPDDADQDFAYTGASSAVIGDRVWFDIDGDGTEDVGEVGFSGVAVTLTWSGPNGVLSDGDDVVQATTTGPTGSYEFDDLPNGTFQVVVEDSTLPPGLVPTHDDDGTTTAHRSEVTITPSQPFDRDQDFGYTGVGSIGDLVWLDVDDSATSTADAGEPGIAGVDVVVVWDNPQGSDVTYTVTTDADGRYLVPRLPEGDYTINVQTATLPGGLTPTYDPDGTGTADVAVVTLTSAAPDLDDRDFSYTGVGSIGDTVWFDEDASGAPDPAGSGVFDGADQALAGIGVTVTWGGFDGVVGDDPATTGVDESSDDIDYRATTGGSGEWLVPDLPYGPYRVQVDDGTLPSGITDPTFDGDGVATVGVSRPTLDAASPDDLDQDFSYTGIGSVGDRVWFDLDGDGEVDAGEVGLAGVAVTLTYTGPDGSTVTATTVTGPDGTYGFDHLPLDVTLTITVDADDLPGTFDPTHDPDGTGTANTSAAILTAAEPAATDLDFGYRGRGSIGDLVWLDRDRSGTATIDSGDVPLPGVGVIITWDNPVAGGDDLIATVTTGADGRYLLPGLPDGSYTIVVDALTLPAGVTATFDPDGTATPNASTAILAATSPDDLGHDFSYAGTGSIGDLIWDDLDGDGLVDVGEPALGGVPVTLSYSDPVTGVTFTETVTTEPDGGFSFDDLPAGGYEIEIDRSALPPGYGPTYDVDTTITPDRVSLPLEPAEDRVDVDFGYRLQADLGIVKTHDGDFAVGAENRWTMAITNDGPAAAAAPVEIVDTLPAAVTYLRAESDDWQCAVAARTMTCTYVGPGGAAAVPLPAGSATTIDVVVSVAAGAAPAVTNTASVTSPTPDQDPTDDASSDPTAVPLAVLGLDKALAGNELIVGQEATYELIVTNYGPSATRGEVRVSDDLPAGLRLVSADPGPDPSASCDVTGATVTCVTTSELDIGDTWTVAVVVDVTAGPGSTVVNDATVSGGNQVNGVDLAPSVIDSIYDQLADPTSGLGPMLGIGPIAPPASDQFPATVSAPILAFTGATTRYLLTVGPLLVVAGGFLILVARARRLQTAEIRRGDDR